MCSLVLQDICVTERSNTDTVSAEMGNLRSTRGMYKLYLSMFRRHKGNYVY